MLPSLLAALSRPVSGRSLSAIQREDGSIALTWEAPAPTEVRYEIEGPVVTQGCELVQAHRNDESMISTRTERTVRNGSLCKHHSCTACLVLARLLLALLSAPAPTPLPLPLSVADMCLG